MTAKPYKNKAWMIKMYVMDGKTAEEIAELCKVHPATIYEYIKKFGIGKRR